MSRNKNLSLKKRLAFTAITALLVFLALELVMIVAEPVLFRGFYQYDSDLGFKVRPYTNGTNRFGFNDIDHPLKKPKNSYRILILSDSFNWAGGKKNNYVTLVRNKMQQRIGKQKVTVINAGYPMTHTGEQLALLNKFALQYEPDFVFLGFFMGNDYIDADPYRKRIVLNDTVFDIDPRMEIVIGGYPIIPYSRLFHYLQQKFTLLKELAGASISIATAATENVSPFSLSEETYFGVRREQLIFFDKKQHDKKVYQERIDFIHQKLAAMNQLLTQKKIKFAVGIYPDQLQVDKDLLNRVMQQSETGAELKEIDVTLTNKILSKYLDQIGVDHYDLQPAFAAAIRPSELYLPYEIHWNLKGNQVAENLVFNYLVQKMQETTINIETSEVSSNPSLQ